MRKTLPLLCLVALCSPFLPHSYARAAAADAITLPADDARHPGDANLPEWWYYNGHVATKDGKQAYGFELVFFQYKIWGIPVRAVQFALTSTTPDTAEKKFDYHTWLFPGHYRTVKNGFDLSVPGGPEAKGGDGTDHVHAVLPDGAALDLNLQTLKRATLEMGTGVIAPVDPSTQTEIGRELYYSRTRIQAQGTLTANGVATKLGGLSWFDHEWGKLARVGWAWYSIILDNGQEIMAYDMFEKPGAPASFSGAEVIGTCFDCGNLVVGPKEFSMPLSGAWKSPHSGITYPNAFGFEIPTADTKLELTPLVEDAELKSPFLPSYWEGPVTVSGVEYGHPVTGQGYVELTGF